MTDELRKRVVIENVRPQIDCGSFPIKRVLGEKVVVEADVFTDGHDSVSVSLLYKAQGEKDWRELSMTFIEYDRWTGEFIVEKIGAYYYSVAGWVINLGHGRRILRRNSKPAMMQELNF